MTFKRYYDTLKFILFSSSDISWWFFIFAVESSILEEFKFPSKLAWILRSTVLGEAKAHLMLRRIL